MEYRNKMEKTLVDESSDDNIAYSSNFKEIEDDDTNNINNEDQNNIFEIDEGTHKVGEESIPHVSEQVEKLSIPTDKQAIQSQQQRLQREAQFSIPYHKPKKYTLKEFLSRRTIIKPCESAKENGFSEALGRSKNLKMSKEELEIYSKLMEDRAKEASEFFKDDNTDDSKQKGGNCEEKVSNSEHETRNKANTLPQKLNKSNENEKCRGENVSNIVITEIVELPKLNLNDIAKDLNLKNIINQTLMPKERTEFPLESNLKVPQLLEASPTLNGKQDITFDLISTENDTPKTISRANSLLERLMKTNTCHKPKTNDTIGIKRMKCKTNTLIDEAEPYSNKKPGESFLKLKDNLKSIILEKRREELKKKQMEENNTKNAIDNPKYFEDSMEYEDKLSRDSSDNSESETDGESVQEEHSEDDDEDVAIDKIQTPLWDSKPSDVGSMRIELDSDDSNGCQHFNPSVISQVPATQICNPDEEADQLINLCSGTFETQPTNTPKEIIDNEILSSSEENSPRSSGKNIRTKKFTKKIKKSKMKLGFSDDEADESDDPDTNEVTSEKNVSINDEPATYIDYDSEENEITVELTKQDCLKKAETFFEREAELSESDWGSADEDEKNLDQYENEVGDEDVFDKEEIRDELGKIHARKMLDEDLRQVHKLQEILFEDEDEAAQRQRKFRWKNLDNSFNLEISQNNVTETKPEEEGSDDENEHLWRKIRFEREQAIKDHFLNENILEASTSDVTSKINDIRNVTRINVSKSIVDGSDEKEKSPFLISKELIKTESAKARSSFLLRNKKVLSKTICSVKSSSNDINTSPDKIGVKTTNSNKFVFTTLTFEEHETLKRKADDTNGGIDTKIIKKAKTETKKGEFLIDKLL
ncbi:claspin [Bactrocera tryoni]|uniref:claspin n=1 Tax=Bactrocera tryoni TaxID=59916 RepID=UPI001A98B6D8|nr:claspin [Bactrocera tryoni]